MELRQIRYFIAVGEEEHFGRASERIRIAQPALSRQIRLLEDELGVTLFVRQPRGVKLSGAGRVLLDHCRKIVRDLEHAVDEARAADRGETGMLKLGFIEVAAWNGIIPESIMAFRRANPGVRLALRSMSTLEQVEAIADGRIDAGFLYNPLGSEEGLSVLPVARHTVLLAVRCDDPLAGREAVDVEMLADMPFISFQRRQSPSYYDELHGGLFNAGVAVNVVHEAENEAEMLALVTAGQGVTLVNECQQWRMPQGVALISVRGLDVWLDLALVYRADQALSGLQRFLSCVRMRIGGGSAA